MRKEDGDLQIGKLPDLRMVDIRSLRFHEDYNEERVLTLIERLGAEGILKNPPVVASVEKREQYILLDGANRVTALAKMNFNHIPVQVVLLSDPLLRLSSWHHAVERFGKDHFLGNLSDQPGLKIEESGSGKAKEDLLCRLIFRHNESFNIYNSSGLTSRIAQLNFITDLYLHTSCSDRVSYTDLEHLGRHYPDFQTLVLFKDFTKEEINEISDLGRKLPSGLTRIILPKRALGLNVRLELLKSSLSLSEKNHWLKETIHKKVIEKSIRFYQEQTFVFNE